MEELWVCILGSLSRGRVPVVCWPVHVRKCLLHDVLIPARREHPVHILQAITIGVQVRDVLAL